MGSVPVLKPREVVALLERLGFVEVRQRGSHKQYRHADGRSTTVPFHSGRDISPILLRKIARVARSGDSMKKKASARSGRSSSDRDTMRREYDFSKAKRGVTAIRYAEGANVVVIDPEVLDVFPDGAAVNEALRALAPVIRKQRKRRSA